MSYYIIDLTRNIILTGYTKLQNAKKYAKYYKNNNMHNLIVVTKIVFVPKNNYV